MDPLDTSEIGFSLQGVRVVEHGDHRGEFAGKLLANLGADVVKVEPPGGARSRGIGPFFEEKPGAERSLYSWHYNQGKRGVTLDAGRPEGAELLQKLIDAADVLVKTVDPNGIEAANAEWERLHAEHPRLVALYISDFGLAGPWAKYKGGDIIALALGGQMMTAGYPPAPDGKYDTPPIAPQMHQSTHLVGCLGAMDVLASLAYRDRSGRGQRIDMSLHAATNSCTENHLSWYMIGDMISARRPQFPEMFTGDGKYMQVMLGLFPGEWERIVEMMDRHEMAEDLKDPKYADPLVRRRPEVRTHLDEVVQTFLATQTAEEMFLEAQDAGVIWAPIRQPHESLDDEHFVSRGNFAEVEHEDVGRSLTYPGSPWVSEALPWRTGPRAPRVGEHNEAVYTEWLGLPVEEVARLKGEGVL